jgi:hypothetical protein
VQRRVLLFGVSAPVTKQSKSHRPSLKLVDVKTTTVLAFAFKLIYFTIPTFKILILKDKCYLYD